MTGDARPDAFCGVLERVSRDHVLNAFQSVEAVINREIPWKDGSAQLLAVRAKNIRRLVAEVWR